MKPPRGTRHGFWSRLVLAAIRWAGSDPSRDELVGAVSRDWRLEPGRGGLRFSERLRDIYRRRWLRVRR